MSAAPPTARPLPPGWRWARLGDVADYINGRAFKPSEWEKTGLPIIRIENLTSADALCNYYTGAVDERHRVRDGDLLISWSASLDAFLWDRGDAVLNQHIFKVMEKRDVADRDYLYMVAKHVMTDIRSKIHGGTMQHITKPLFEAVPIPLPPLLEQRRIAAILRDQLDAVRRAREAALARLEAARALPAAFLRSVFDSEEARSWPRAPLGQLCSIRANQVDPKLPQYRDLPHVSGENIESGTARLLPLRTAAEDGMISGKYLFEPGDVLYSKLRPYLRKVALATRRGLCSADMYPLRPNSDVDPRWLTAVLLSEEFTRYADDESKRVRMPKLNREQLFAWEAPVVPLHDQQRFAEGIFHGMSESLEVEIVSEAELAAIDGLPPSLLRCAFAGGL